MLEAVNFCRGRKTEGKADSRGWTTQQRGSLHCNGQERRRGTLVLSLRRTFVVNSSELNLKKNNTDWAGEAARQGPGTKPSDLCFVPWTHVEKEKTDSPKLCPDLPYAS